MPSDAESEQRTGHLQAFWSGVPAALPMYTGLVVVVYGYEVAGYPLLSTLLYALVAMCIAGLVSVIWIVRRNKR